MKRVASLDCITQQYVGVPFPRGLRQRITRRLSMTTSAAAAKAASWSSYIRQSSAPRRLGSSVANMTWHLSRHSLQVLNAVALAGYPSDDNLTVDLDWRPTLSATQEVICWSVAALTTCCVYAFTAPSGVNIVYGTCIGLLFGLLLYTLRNALLEEMYKARERIEADLGDSDSRFRHIDNLSVHVKVKSCKTLPPPLAPTAAAARLTAPAAAAAAAKAAVPALHCYHGFGSNTWSWSLVQQQLADRLGALVTAHDMPGFGLTQRPTDLSGYYLAFNGRLGRLAMDYELTVRGLMSQAEADKAGEAGYPHTSVHALLDAAADRSSSSSGGSSAAAAAAGEIVQGLEAASGGTAAEAADQAVQQGLESPLQAAAAVTGTSSSSASEVASDPSSSSSSSSAGAPGSQQRVKRVLMGHSLGGACAALEYIANPTDYAGIVLVDPAIIAGLSFGSGSSDDSSSGSSSDNGKPTLQKLQDGTAFTRSLATGEFEQPEVAAAAAHLEEAAAAGGAGSSAASDGGSSTELDELAAAQGNLTRSSSANATSSSSSAGLNAAAAAGHVVFYATLGDDASFQALLSPNNSGNLLAVLVGKALGLAQTAAMLSTLLIISALRPVIVALLRVLVRSRAFWANTLKQAYYDQSKVTPAAVDAYRLPQLVRGWETGMVQFLLARLGAGGSQTATTAASAAGAAPMGGLEDAGLAKRFAAAVAAHNTPVLIVHGSGDKLVPASNSFNLAKLIKGCRLAVVKRAGHCPQEEEPEVFADIVGSFLHKHVGQRV